MKKLPLIELIALFVFLAALACAQSQTLSSPDAERRVQVDEATSSEMVVQKAPLQYPDAARKAGTQGKVVLRIVTSFSGDVKEVTVVSGDPALAQAAVDAVKQRKYKPYLVEGSPAEMETQVTFNFQIKAPTPPAAPPLGTFRDDAYSNDYFGVYYPLSRDWVRETDLMRKKLASEGNTQGSYLLLAEVHIPQNTDPLRADSSFIVFAVNRPATQDCRQYLELAANKVQSQKEGKQQGGISKFNAAGHDFYRADFEYSQGVDHRAFLCTATKEYMLQWNIIGLSKQAIEAAISTLDSMTPEPPPAPASTPATDSNPRRVRLNQGVTQGSRVKFVQPLYPAEARKAHVQGTVRMSAVINTTGDIANLEVVDGPIELVVSAVNAVRKWKYRPYRVDGAPVEVQTEITVNYSLQ
jgi:TonB family protein